VGVFLTILSSLLTQYDQATATREMKRGGHVNIYRLGLLMGALGKVRADVAKVVDSDDAEALAKLKASVSDHFEVSFAPVKKLFKQIDTFLASGKLPSIPIARKGAAEGVFSSEERGHLLEVESKTVLDRLLDRVKPGKSELTLDITGYSRAQVDKIIAVAKARGLDAAASPNSVLIRDLSNMHLKPSGKSVGKAG
jgi:hypothetical protein